MTARGTRPAGKHGLATALAVVFAAAVLLTGVTSPPSASADGNEGPTNGAPFRSITAGYRHSCALLANGAVKCWGNNSAGQLGLGDDVGRGDGSDEMGDHLPTVSLGPGRTATALAAGAGFTCAILDNATLKCWGDNLAGQLGQGDALPRGDGPGEMGANLPAIDLGTGRTAVAVAAGFGHTCAILDTGAVKCWGHNSYGQLGLGDKLTRGALPNQMGNNLPTVDLGTGRTAVAITAADFSTCVLLDNGTIKCWGRNNVGQLGLGDTADRGDQANEMGDLLPSVNLGASRTATALTAGGGGPPSSGHVCALLDDATVKCWGNSAFGQLGLGTGSLGFGSSLNRGDEANEMGDNLPAVALGSGRTASAIAAGQSHSCAVLDNATVKCWGGNSFGQLGLGLPATQNLGDQANEMGDNLSALNLGSSVTPVAVTAGTEHGCVRFADGSLKCWGRNDNGGLGLGNTASRGIAASDMGDNLPKVDLGRTTGDVTGTLTEAGSGTPLGGAWVLALRLADFSVAGGDVTDPSGEFALTVEGGDYLLYLLDPSGAHTAAPHGGSSVQTTTVPTGGSVDVDPVMTSVRGSVDSTVTDAASGDPIPGAWALALSANPNNTGALEAGVVADGSGHAVLSRLQPGNHFVALVDPSGGHGTRFFPDSPSVPGSTPVAVGAGGTTVANAALPAQTALPAGEVITGAITDSGTGAPISGAQVVALKAADYAMARGAVADAGGHYSLALPAGSYFLAVLDPSGHHLTEWFDDTPGSDLASATAVTAPGTADAQLAPTGGSMAGTITAASGGAPLPGAWVVAIGPTGIAGGAVTAADGTYRIDALAPGTYRAAIVDPTGAHATEYFDDAGSFPEASAFPVTTGGTVTVDAALTSV